ncbi:hypothetical protein PMAYCL1PPCAC_32647, partial [Pristionchus mayeri]
DNKKKEKAEKEEKPLKKAEDESSSSEEEDDKKDKENKTTIAPSRKRREYDSHGGQIYADIDRFDHQRNYRDADSTLKKAKELDHIPMNTPDIEHRSGRSRRAENTLKKAKEMEQLPMGHHDHHEENAVRQRPRRAEHSHAQTGEVVLSRAQELNDGEKTPLVIDEKAGSRPDYRRKSSSGRKRRAGDIVLGKAQELNGGERTEIERTEGTATRPDYRKNSRTRRTLERHFNRARRTLEASSVSSEENTLKKATELNDGERRPVDKLPSQSTMPEKVKAHKRRAVRHSNIRNQSGNQHDSTEDTEEWKLENEEDYDDGGNSR